MVYLLLHSTSFSPGGYRITYCCISQYSLLFSALYIAAFQIIHFHIPGYTLHYYVLCIAAYRIIHCYIPDYSLLYFSLFILHSWLFIAEFRCIYIVIILLYGAIFYYISCCIPYCLLLHSVLFNAVFRISAY